MAVTKLRNAGIVWIGEGAPDASTGEGRIGRGYLYIDALTANCYVNTGSTASPAFAQIGGGSGSDPLALQNYLAVGAAPAQVGAVRLASGEALASASQYGVSGGSVAILIRYNPATGYVEVAPSGPMLGTDFPGGDVLVSGGKLLYTGGPTSNDPAIDGALFTCTAAELNDLLTAGAKYVLMSKGSP